MNKPYIICHMMTSVDGRIDCEMVGKLKGVEEYYETLKELNIPTTVSGRVTAELELALPGKFENKNTEPYGKAGFSKKTDAKGYEVVVDTKGTLLWKNAKGMEKPYLIVTSENVSKEYLAYLDEQNISWIACGAKHIDIKEMSRILAEEFCVKRMGIVGGPMINTAFLDSGLLDEVSILIGLGIDGRGEMPPVFNGLPKDREPIKLKLETSKVYKTGAVWLRYSFE